MKTFAVGVLGFFLGVVVSWALCVFVLHLHWETSLLVIEISAVLGAIVASLTFRRWRRSRKGQA